MKKLLSILFISLCLFACSKDGDTDYLPILPEEPEYPDPEESERPDPFEGYNVTDTIGLSNISIITSQRDTNFVFISGFKNNKIWYGMFDRKSKKPIFELEDKETFNYAQTAHLGYGEYKDFVVGKIKVFDNIKINETEIVYLSFIEKKKEDFAIDALYTTRLDFINQNKITKSIYNDFYHIFYTPQLYNWTNAVIEIYNSKLSSYSLSGDLNFETNKIGGVFYQRNAYSAINLEECISISEGVDALYINRENIKNNRELWQSKIDKKYPNGKVNNFTFEYSQNICTITFTITSFEGIKENISIKIDIETGKVLQ